MSNQARVSKLALFVFTALAFACSGDQDMDAVTSGPSRQTHTVYIEVKGMVQQLGIT